MGFNEEKSLSDRTLFDKPYYLMPVSMSVDEKEKLLLKAFDEGAVVVIDEINASPMMERLLNDLLMGQRPKRNDGSMVPVDTKPGFMIIGTQNPITMSGRRAASTAFKRRMITTTVPDYTPEEMGHILHCKGVPRHEADKMVQIYQRKRAFATLHHLSPVPNFRQLERMADAFVASGIKAIYLPQKDELLAVNGELLEMEDVSFQVNLNQTNTVSLLQMIRRQI